MTVPAGMWEAALRALILGVALAAVAPGVQRLLAARPRYWLALALPMLTPSVVVGHAYVGWSPGASGSAALELGYGLLLAARLLPVAAVLQWVLPPPPLSPRGRFGLRLAGELRLRDRRFGALRNRVVVAGVVFVLAFQEFELASLFYGIRTWTVTLFDAQAGGLALPVTLHRILAPVAVELAVLALVVGLFVATRVPGAPAPEEREAAPAPAPVLGRVWVLGGCLLLTVVPGVFLVPAAGGLGAQLHMLTDIRHSVLLAGGATAAAVILASTCRLRLLAALCVPGLAGGLVLALALQGLFQTRLLAGLYDTPVPVLLAWVLLLLPVAVVLRLLRERLTGHRGLHAARLLAGSPHPGQRRAGGRLVFRLAHLPAALVAVLLFLLAFFEVVAGDLLAPGGMTPAAPRLYNLMHYGRSPGLAAMVLLMALSAVLCAGAALGLWSVLAGSPVISRWFPTPGSPVRSNGR